jgi:hypothetical protein
LLATAKIFTIAVSSVPLRTDPVAEPLQYVEGPVFLCPGLLRVTSYCALPMVSEWCQDERYELTKPWGLLLRNGGLGAGVELVFIRRLDASTPRLELDASKYSSRVAVSGSELAPSPLRFRRPRNVLRFRSASMSPP